MSPGSRTTPLTEEARADFASYAAAIARAAPGVRHVIVGNEPNLNRFWLPQFALDGSNAASPAYLQLLAETYDALKAVSSNVRVYGGAVSPRGSDRAGGSRPTHSPTAFIRDLGLAYRASGRDRPVMDAFVIHPTATTRASRRRSPIRRTRRSRSPTTASSSRSSARRSTGPPNAAPISPSSTGSTGSSPRSPRARRGSTPGPSPRRRGRSPRRRRRRTTSRRSASPSASRRSRRC